MICTQILRQSLFSSGSIEHPAECGAIHDSALNAKSNDPTRELVHDKENPMCLQRRGFAAKEVETPKAVLHVAEESEPRWTTRIGVRLVMNVEDAANPILVDLDIEGQSNLLSDSWTSPRGISLLHLENCLNQFLAGSFGTGSTPPLGRE